MESVRAPNMSVCIPNDSSQAEFFWTFSVLAPIELGIWVNLGSMALKS
jgi:hypothetical protein